MAKKTKDDTREPYPEPAVCLPDLSQFDPAACFKKCEEALKDAKAGCYGELDEACYEKVEELHKELKAAKPKMAGADATKAIDIQKWLTILLQLLSLFKKDQPETA